MTSPPASKSSAVDTQLLRLQRTAYLTNGTLSSPASQIQSLLGSARTPANTTEYGCSRLSIHPGPHHRLLCREIHRNKAGIEKTLLETMRLLADGKLKWPLTLIGVVGSGKTCAALYLADVVGGGCLYSSVDDLALQFNEARFGRLFDALGQKVFPMRFWADWGASPLTVVDEIGTRENTTDAVYEVLKRAIDLREGKPAVYVSNLELADISRLIDDRISSRLASGTVYRMGFSDRRIPE